MRFDAEQKQHIDGLIARRVNRERRQQAQRIAELRAEIDRLRAKLIEQQQQRGRVDAPVEGNCNGLSE